MAAAPEPGQDFWDNYQPVQHPILQADPNQGVEVDDLYDGGKRRRRTKRVKGRKSRKSRRSKRRRSRSHKR